MANLWALSAPQNPSLRLHRHSPGAGDAALSTWPCPERVWWLVAWEGEWDCAEATLGRGPASRQAGRRETQFPSALTWQSAQSKALGSSHPHADPPSSSSFVPSPFPLLSQQPLPPRGRGAHSACWKAVLSQEQPGPVPHRK